MIKGIDYPEWLTAEGLITLSKGYLQKGETPKDMYKRVSKAAAQRLNRNDLANSFFDIMWKGWLGPASPVLANMGTERGLPISCFKLSVPDSVDGIFKSVHELAVMSKHGGGVGVTMSNVRGRKALIHGNGESEGVVPWIKVFDSATVSVSQGSTRRGATSINLDIDHTDIEEFLKIRKPQGDVNRQCLNIHHCVVISDEFMEKVKNGDKEARAKWAVVCQLRMETGEPYIMFKDTVNKNNPQCYKDRGLKVEGTNICTEITGFTDKDHSFVCCLSSLNLAKWDEWKDTDTVELATWFLDGVMQEFIEKARHIQGFERAVRFAEKSRMLGLGVMGWHTLLQSKNIPFDSFDAMRLNALWSKTIKDKADKASQGLAKEYGEPEWLVGSGFRNSHRIAIAPTVSNSVISGGISAGIEPIAANAYVNKTAKGVFLVKNPTLTSLLESLGKNTEEVWKDIVINEGSVQHLDFLDEKTKEVFLTAREINQLAIIKQAAQRQRFIDQSQSVNLFFPVNVDPKFFHKVHMEAWELGLKTLYYCRSSSVLKADVASRQKDECKACEG